MIEPNSAKITFAEKYDSNEKIDEVPNSSDSRISKDKVEEKETMIKSRDTTPMQRNTFISDKHEDLNQQDYYIKEESVESVSRLDSHQVPLFLP